MRLINLDPYNWEKYRENIFASDSVFPDELAIDEEEYMEELSKEYSFSRVALVKDRYAGNIVSSPNSEMGEEYEFEKLFFCYSVVVDPQFQNRGLATTMIQKSMQFARENGFRHYLGCFREGASHNVALKCGMQKIETIEDFWNTRETFYTMVRSL